ncbi:MarR family winged helix-turn-helix transcriptional regulator [Streptomyces sp. NPDC005529]|uniref:MarR family winged helix-turn-helix transcriptional regulator n=1 Tax=unclassified Streptomyces TaxID=2593676 RepID=UPI0033B25A42
MTEHTGPDVPATARHIGSVGELLDVLWEQARNDGPPPYIPASQLRVMYIVDRDNEIRMHALGRLLGAAPPSVSRLVDRLQALGFIERRPCPDSRREITLTITPGGRKHLARLRARRDRLLAEALNTLPDHQCAGLAEGLAGLQQALAERPSPALGLADTPPALPPHRPRAQSA